MGRKSEVRAVKCAWIDDAKKLISFSHLPDTDNFSAEEAAFWQKITQLMQAGYWVQ